jgi:ATP-dependent DNA ligase
MAGMQLPVNPPVAPMLAKPVKAIPSGDYGYEPKWDGFRCIVFRDGDEIELGSRNERPLTRYFPEVVEAVRANLPPRCVLDGEVIVPTGERLDFDALQQRIHPAASRVNRLAQETPAHFVAFDLLAIGDDAHLQTPFRERRALLESALADAAPPVHLTPLTRDRDLATQWFEQFEGAGLDGLVAKAGDSLYRPDERVMFKIKHERTADCVLAGLRWHKNSTAAKPLVGSLMLGLYDDEGTLHHIGVSASFTAARRAELAVELEALIAGADDDHPWMHWAEFARDAEAAGQRLPGAQSRWNAKKDLSFVALRPERVLEVKYDHMEGPRLRHTAQFVRWRPDRDPRSCNYSQLIEPVSYDLQAVMSAR